MLMTAGDAGATKYVREPAMEDLAQVWIGTVPKGILEFFRLELDDKGVGLLTVQYLPQEPARAYRVRRTTLAKYEFDSCSNLWEQMRSRSTYAVRPSPGASTSRSGVQTATGSVPCFSRLKARTWPA